ncbi:MAG: cytochrome c biogenesis protein, partial [Waddliaceae bacterium]
AVDFATAELFSVSLKNLAASRDVMLDYSLTETEVFYLRLRPFHNAWILYLTAILFSLPMVLRRKEGGAPLWRKGFGLVSLVLFLAGFAIHSYGIYLRCVIAGRPPVSNMYESIIWVSWVVVLFSMIYYFIWKSLYVRNIAAFVAAFILILAEKFPVVFSPAISPLVPVLRSNLWLTVHVLTITMSYGAFALAWGLGHGVVFDFAFRPGNRERKKQSIKCLYLTLQVGVVLLAAGTILGGVWANYSWGRFWGWDPKETWALIALLGYLAVFHGRYARWLGDFGMAVGSIVAFLGVVVAWYGVNYVLAAGLHSYGFGGGGSVYVLLAALLDLILVAILAWRYKRSSSIKQRV